ncbi:MAG: hypothetical protein IJH34_10210 [Romboutsia sp.]|nr:hypothetical protein [Romboutsia sp.]
MFGMKKRAEKKQEKRDVKSLEQLEKDRSKLESKVIKKLSKKLDKDESVTGIVAYNSNLCYIAKTNKNRFFVGGVQGFKTTETVLTRDNIHNVSKAGLMPAYINLELVNSSIRLFGEANITKADKLYMDVINLIG